MVTTRLSKGRGLLAILLLSGAVGPACGVRARYPEAGQPGPVVTAAGDTIPEGSDRDTFMAGYRAGLDAVEVTPFTYLGTSMGGIFGALIGGVGLSRMVDGSVPAADNVPGVAVGVGLMAAARWLGGPPELPLLPAHVVDRGPLYLAGYREGFAHGHRVNRRRVWNASVVFGLLLSVLTSLALSGG